MMTTGADKEPAAILVVDDEPQLCELVASMLSGGEHAVLCAGSGEEALSRAQAHGGEISLLVTDVMMPGMNGMDLARELCRQRPELRVLFISAYVGGGDHTGLDPRKMAVLPKPFTINELLLHVRLLLRAAGERRLS
jgi:DNA-binding response OmpR family regulator